MAKALIARGGWSVHIVDVKDDIGPLPPNMFYHKADTTNYGQLTAAFKAAWAASGKRLDFLFANAGILERTNWFAKSESPDEPPEEPQWAALEVNLKGCMNTVRIGRHYMAQNPDGGAIVVTSSSAGIWPTYCSPIYTASKRTYPNATSSSPLQAYLFGHVTNVPFLPRRRHGLYARRRGLVLHFR